jgi:hypothetical protein
MAELSDDDDEAIMASILAQKAMVEAGMKGKGKNKGGRRASVTAGGSTGERAQPRLSPSREQRGRRASS